MLWASHVHHTGIWHFRNAFIIIIMHSGKAHTGSTLSLIVSSSPLVLTLVCEVVLCVLVTSLRYSGVNSCCLLSSRYRRCFCCQPSSPLSFVTAADWFEAAAWGRKVALMTGFSSTFSFWNTGCHLLGRNTYTASTQLASLLFLLAHTFTAIVKWNMPRLW